MTTGTFSTEKLETYLDGFNASAKDAIAKSARLGQDLAELAQGNLEAATASARLAAKAAEEMAHDGAAIAKAGYENATATLKRYAAVKTPAELFALHAEVAKAAFDDAMNQASKFGEAGAKVAGDVVEPLSARYAVASEKLKSALGH